VLHGQKEAETVEVLKTLFISRKSLKHMATQALLKNNRILKKFFVQSFSKSKSSTTYFKEKIA
jgi:hypothetical protein